MATPYVGWLYMDRGFGSPMEVINNARTIEHLRNSDAWCNAINVRGSECEVLYKDPCDYTAMNFLTPSTGDTAPWWDGVADSPTAHAYGFWVKEWTGLGGEHITRQATATYPRGAQFGSLSQGPRIWKISLHLFGRDALALEELFRWLEETLIDGCERCAGMKLWMRTACPDGYSDDYGLATVGDVALVEGLRWDDAPTRGLGCFMRSASFTIGVGDPLYYAPPAAVTESATTWSEPDHCTVGLAAVFGCPDECDSFAAYQITGAIPAATRGKRAPIVTLANANADHWSFPFQVAGVSNLLDGAANLCQDDVRGQVYIKGVPPQHEVRVDCARRRVYKRRLGYRRPWERAEDLYDTRLGTPVWPGVDCVAGAVVVQPTFLTENMDDVTVTIETVQRWGGA